MSSLRSRSSFLVLNVNTGLSYVWHGCKSPQHTHKLAMTASTKSKEKCPLEVGLHQKAAKVVIEMEEGWWPEGDKEQAPQLLEKEPGNPCKAYVVYVGLEPLKFTNLFPFWTVDEAARESNLKIG